MFINAPWRKQTLPYELGPSAVGVGLPGPVRHRSERPGTTFEEGGGGESVTRVLTSLARELVPKGSGLDMTPHLKPV